ncbi:MAG: hypothetical protein PHS79_05335 [Patescibacteria group bacterium]|nr:hypothetical protein [Patescibacteria group bacterium]
MRHFVKFMFAVLVAVGFTSNVKADVPGQKWHVVMGARAFAPRCDAIGDIVIGGEDGKTPIYSCRNGDDWQAVKGNQMLTPHCTQMKYIWWSPEQRAVMYTCTDDAVMIGNQPQPQDGPWAIEQVDYLEQVNYQARLCSGYDSDCMRRLVHKEHKNSYGYEDVKPRRFPDGVLEITFEWSSPVPIAPAPSEASDVEVVNRPYNPPPPCIGCYGSSADGPSAPYGMPSADPTRIPSGKPAAVSCGDEVVTWYLGDADKAVWIKRDGDKLRVCAGKSLGKAWDDTWDVTNYDDGTPSYFARGNDNWRLVSGTTEAPAYESIAWHSWVKVNGRDARAYIATGKVGESTPAVYGMLDGRQVSSASHSAKFWRFIPSAGTFVFATQG